jgi:hypothetical protein
MQQRIQRKQINIFLRITRKRRSLGINSNRRWKTLGKKDAIFTD